MGAGQQTPKRGPGRPKLNPSPPQAEHDPSSAIAQIQDQIGALCEYCQKVHELPLQSARALAVEVLCAGQDRTDEEIATLAGCSRRYLYDLRANDAWLEALRLESRRLFAVSAPALARVGLQRALAGQSDVWRDVSRTAGVISDEAPGVLVQVGIALGGDLGAVSSTILGECGLADD